MSKYTYYDVRIFDRFINKFAERYINQRSATSVPPALLKAAITTECGFDLNRLEEIIRCKSVAVNLEREQGEKPTPLNDIYRSDLGELLMTYYFEEKIDDENKFIIPLKNITYRELAQLPGRGFDAIGYRKESDGKINVLIGEAKVSGQKKNPPPVVDINKDSIYKTQKLHHDNTPMVLQRLTDYLKRLGGDDFVVIGCVVSAMDAGGTNDYTFTYGCVLIRDYTCVDKNKDYGKMKTNVDEFLPGDVHFAIMSFTEETIDNAVDIFYKKVQELVK